MDNIKPCPVCGGPAVAVGKWHECADANCDMNGLPLPTWNRLSSQAARIAALEAEAAPLRELWAAVEGLGARREELTCGHNAEDGWVIQSWSLVDGMVEDGAIKPTLTAALIALAQRVGEAPDA